MKKLIALLIPVALIACVADVGETKEQVEQINPEPVVEVEQAAKASCSPSPQTKYTSGGWGWGGAHINNCNSSGKTTSLQGASTVVPNQAGGCVCRTNDENLNYGTHCNTYINSGYWSVTWTCTTN